MHFPWHETLYEMAIFFSFFLKLQSQQKKETGKSVDSFKFIDSRRLAKFSFLVDG